MNLITVAIPVYNCELYLGKAIESVLAQTYPHFILIIINDGSTDSSMVIAKSFKDSRIIILDDFNNKGLAVRLNEIIDLCNTPFLARMDADDIMHPKRLERQIQLLIKDPTIDVLGTNSYIIDENDVVLGIRYRIESNSLIRVKTFMHPTILGRTDWFKNNKYDINAIRLEDLELWYRSSSSSNFFILCEPLLFYREVGNGYFKKFFLANKSFFYLVNKYGYNFFWLKFFFFNFVKGFLYRVFHFFGSEKLLIRNRNFTNFNEENIFNFYE